MTDQFLSALKTFPWEGRYLTIVLYRSILQVAVILFHTLHHLDILTQGEESITSKYGLLFFLYSLITCKCSHVQSVCGVLSKPCHECRVLEKDFIL